MNKIILFLSFFISIAPLKLFSQNDSIDSGSKILPNYLYSYLTDDSNPPILETLINNGQTLMLANGCNLNVSPIEITNLYSNNSHLVLRLSISTTSFTTSHSITENLTTKNTQEIINGLMQIQNYCKKIPSPYNEEIQYNKIITPSIALRITLKASPNDIKWHGYIELYTYQSITYNGLEVGMINNGFSIRGNLKNAISDLQQFIDILRNNLTTISTYKRKTNTDILFINNTSSTTYYLKNKDCNSINHTVIDKSYFSKIFKYNLSKITNIIKEYIEKENNNTYNQIDNWGNLNIIISQNGQIIKSELTLNHLISKEMSERTLHFIFNEIFNINFNKIDPDINSPFDNMLLSIPIK